MIEEEILEVPEEVNQPTPDEQYFSRSLDKWIYVSDMNDMHVRRAFKRLLRMIRLGQLVELYDANKETFKSADVIQEIHSIKSHCDNILKKVDE